MWHINSRVNSSVTVSNGITLKNPTTNYFTPAIGWLFTPPLTLALKGLNSLKPVALVVLTIKWPIMEIMIPMTPHYDHTYTPIHIYFLCALEIEALNLNCSYF